MQADRAAELSGERVGREGAVGDGAILVAAAFEAMGAARAPAVHASTPAVRRLAGQVAQALALGKARTALLDLAVRVRDIGMVGLPDSVVLATAPLSAADWELINRHPLIGAELLERHPAVAAAAGIVRAHHERWDGEGYPEGRSGEGIPLLSRVIATCDAFVAMASDRPHRRGMGSEAALDHVLEQRGTQFDPRVADALAAALRGPRPAESVGRAGPGAGAVAVKGSTGRSRTGGAGGLQGAVAALEVVPAFAPACERVLAVASETGPSRGEVVAAIESDIGLTISLLRRAQAVRTPHPTTNVADAVTALNPDEIVAMVKALPRAEFPWRTSRLDVLLHHARLHAQLVARAADRIATDVNLRGRDDLLVAALLHDVGKLVLSQAAAEYDAADHKTNPEQRARQEQRTYGVDHASLGGLLLRRWGLPEALAATVAAHHSSEDPSEPGSYVRLADMIAHHAQGHAVDRGRMLDLAQLCGLTANALRDVLFDLPHAGGSQRRRAEPSPLSDRETDILRILAAGKVYKQIATELELATSTVRTHLHNAYVKLGVTDRAQAVLHATEMGWI